jgi:putative transposase
VPRGSPDLVKRNFGAAGPGQLHVADFTYVPLDGGGFAYTAFTIDAYAGYIGGWECSRSKETAFVTRAIRQAAERLRKAGHPLTGLAIHHSDYAEVDVKPENLRMACSGRAC